jgi:integrase/recombinase XerD
MSNNAGESCMDLGNRSFVILHSHPEATELIPTQADNDDQLIELWLHGRPVTTVKAYLADISKMRRHINKPLRSITLGDLQGFMDSLTLKPSSVKRKVNAVKSLFAFGQKLGYTRFDVARPLKIASFRDELSERILTTDEVHRLLEIERNPRNRAILFLFYGSGIRVSELASLKWKHVTPRDSSGQITVFGKGGKTRSILIPQQTWDALMKIRKSSCDEEPVFRSRKKGQLTACQIWRIVKAAAKKAGLSNKVSCHHLRHSHASHALDRKAPIHLVQATLGHVSIATTGRYLHARPSDSSGNYLGMD